jgi:hypothetical protein
MICDRDNGLLDALARWSYSTSALTKYSRDANNGLIERPAVRGAFLLRSDRADFSSLFSENGIGIPKHQRFELLPQEGEADP